MTMIPEPFNKDDYILVSIGNVSIDSIYAFDCGDALLNHAFRQVVHGDYYKGVSQTWCLVPVKEVSRIVGYFTISDVTKFAPGSGKLDGIILEDGSSHKICEIYFFAVDKHYNRTALGSGNGFGRYLMRYALKKLLEIYPLVTIVFLESTMAGDAFYPNIGYSYVSQYDFYYMTRNVIERYVLS